MNSPELSAKLTRDDSRPAKLAAGELDGSVLVRTIYLRVFCRDPDEAELERAVNFLASVDDRREAVEDLFWALLNTPEFLFID